MTTSKEKITIEIPSIDEVSFSLLHHREDTPPEDHFSTGNAKEDAQIVGDILKDLDSNSWAWCIVEVRAHYRGLAESEFLGACSYKSEEDFRRCGYFEDMKQSAYMEIVGTIKSLAPPEAM